MSALLEDLPKRIKATVQFLSQNSDFILYTTVSFDAEMYFYQNMNENGVKTSKQDVESHNNLA